MNNKLDKLDIQANTLKAYLSVDVKQMPAKEQKWKSKWQFT